MNQQEDYYSVDAIHATALKYIDPEQGGSPLKFKSYMEDKESFQKMDTRSLQTGRLLHLYLLEPEKYYVSDIKKPSPAVQEIVDDYAAHFTSRGERLPDTLRDALKVLEAVIDRHNYSSKNGMEARVNAVVNRFGGEDYYQHVREASDKIILGEADRELVPKLKDALMENEKIAEMFMADSFDGLETYNEQAIFFDFEIVINQQEVKLPAKSKLDRIVLDPDKQMAWIVDPKTTKGSVYNFHYSVRKYKYHRQMMFYKRALMHFLASLGYEPAEWTIQIYLPVVSTKEPHETMLWGLPVSWQEEGESELNSCLFRLAEHQMKDDWKRPVEYMDRKRIYPLPWEPKE